MDITGSENRLSTVRAVFLNLAVVLIGSAVATAEPKFHSVSSLAELEETLDAARGKPALVRVHADWSVSDTQLDKQLSSACARESLSNIAWIEWDVTAHSDEDRQFLAKYEVFGPPTLLLFDTEGNHLKEKAVVGYLPVEEIVATVANTFGLPQDSTLANCIASEDASKLITWNELIESSYEYLGKSQQALEATYKLSDHDRWHIDQDEGTLTLSKGNHPVAEAEIAIVGSVITAHGVWRWSWANPSVEQKLAAPVDTVRQYGVEHGLDKLTDQGWPAEEFDGWEMAAIANFLLQGKGVYPAPAGDSIVFVVITDIRNVE
ncbi:MAG: hypothetical protein QNJ05_07395 [Woeseiaceae bacterium]|nr:hypothetical protein [Woeseiaceae bacterium]